MVSKIYVNDSSVQKILVAYTYKPSIHMHKV